MSEQNNIIHDLTSEDGSIRISVISSMPVPQELSDEEQFFFTAMLEAFKNNGVEIVELLCVTSLFKEQAKS